MSKKYPGGILSKTAPVPTGPFQSGVASGSWTMEDVVRFKRQGIWPTAGNAAPYIEDVFSTHLYTGGGSAQTFVNDIDLASNGGLVWMASRNQSEYHSLTDTARGVTKVLRTTSNAAEVIPEYQDVTAFNNNGFTGRPTGYGSASTCFWTFRKQPKFFDIVTYTGNGTAGRQISHSLGATPGAVLIKRTNTTGDWSMLHRSLPDLTVNWLRLNSNIGVATNSNYFGAAAGSSVFTVGADSDVNASGSTYIAYLFAHDAGGFGLSGTDNVISCGTFTGNTTVNLGFEPQWIMLKRTDTTGNWYIHDTMRGWPVSGDAMTLEPNNIAAEYGTAQLFPNATGFTTSIGGGTYIYIAIRRGLMKVPTLGTSVFTPVARTGTGTSVTVTGIGFTPDASIAGPRGAGYTKFMATSRLLNNLLLATSSTAAGYSDNSVYPANIYAVMNGINQGGTGALINGSGNQDINWFFKRAPSFFDVVCYSGTGSATTVAHNLTVAPELMIIKSRAYTSNWAVYYGNKQLAYLQSSAAGFEPSPTVWNDTAPTSTVFSVGNAEYVNQSGNAYVAYLFATCAGVSKVGSYTGTAAAQTIDCGFTAGARFVLIKRTDSTGDWYVWDTARGIIAGNDPYLLLNSTAAEVTNTDYVDTYSTGFELSSTAPAALNANGGTYIFLAIA